MAALHLRERLGIFIIRGWSTLPRIFTKLMLPALESTPNRPNESSMQPKPVIKGCQSYAQAVAQIDKELQNAHGLWKNRCIDTALKDTSGRNLFTDEQLIHHRKKIVPCDGGFRFETKFPKSWQAVYTRKRFFAARDPCQVLPCWPWWLLT